MSARESLANYGCSLITITRPWLRAAAKWHLGTMLESGTLRWTTFSQERLKRMRRFGAWLDTLGDPLLVLSDPGGGLHGGVAVLVGPYGVGVAKPEGAGRLDAGLDLVGRVGRVDGDESGAQVGHPRQTVSRCGRVDYEGAPVAALAAQAGEGNAEIAGCRLDGVPTRSQSAPDDKGVEQGLGGSGLVGPYRFAASSLRSNRTVRDGNAIRRAATDVAAPRRVRRKRRAAADTKQRASSHRRLDLVACRNSSRRAASDRSVPRRAVVIVSVPGAWAPRKVIHRCSARRRTPTPAGVRFSTR